MALKQLSATDDLEEYRFDNRLTPERFKARRTRWLRSLDLVSRPWLILGAAPEPTLPARLLHSHARIDINNVGKTAAALGLGRADLTFRARKKSWDEHDALDTRGLLWLHEKPERFEILFRFHLWNRPYRHIGRVAALLPADRDAIVRRVSGTAVDAVGDFGKVTNGVAAACFGLFFDVPEVVLAGISLARSGHSYDGNGRLRLQVPEDAAVLQALRHERRLATTEPDLAEATGIRLLAAKD